MLCRGLLYFWYYGNSKDGRVEFRQARYTEVQSTNYQNAMGFYNLFKKHRLANITDIYVSDQQREDEYVDMRFNIQGFIQIPRNHSLINHLIQVNQSRIFLGDLNDVN